MINLQIVEGKGVVHHNDKIERLWEYGYIRSHKEDENGKVIREENPLMGYGINIFLKDGGRVTIENMEVETVRNIADLVVGSL